jgi:hypothetical protein
MTTYRLSLLGQGPGNFRIAIRELSRGGSNQNAEYGSFYE